MKRIKQVEGHFYNAHLRKCTEEDVAVGFTILYKNHYYGSGEYYKQYLVDKESTILNFANVKKKSENRPIKLYHFFDQDTADKDFVSFVYQERFYVTEIDMSEEDFALEFAKSKQVKIDML